MSPPSTRRRDPGKDTSGSDTRFVALLRGINVGRHNRITMVDLSKFFTEAGCETVRTYIQSGNVVFAAGDNRAQHISTFVSDAIEADLGFRPAICLRTATEIKAIVANNPFIETCSDIGQLHVAFLAHKPDRRSIASLDPDRSPPDSFQVRNREVYIHTPNGLARTKLSNTYFDSVLKTTSTVRNWRTTLKLAEMLA